MSAAAEERPDHATLLARGIAWNTFYQVFQALVSFAAMLVLVRIIPPGEYGRVGAVLGWLALLNAFNCEHFMSQALQLPDGEEPDWSAHWSAALYIQLALEVAAQLLAGLCWLVPRYRPIAPLLHVAALMLLIDAASRLGMTTLRRRLDFRRFRIIAGVSTVASLTVTIALGLAGAGAYAIVIGSNLVTALPFGVDLLVVRRWRPRAGWWRWPDWQAYRPALRFGLQQSLGSLLGALRGALATAVLPVTLGFVAIGLLGRAQALFQTTAGRALGILSETVYPLLPRYAAQPGRYAEKATLFVQAVAWAAILGAAFLGCEGAALSRFLYGPRWAAAAPLFWPAAVAALGTVIAGATSAVLLAANKLRVCFLLDVAGALLTGPLVVVTLLGGDMVTYAWALAAGALASGALGLLASAGHLEPRFWRAVLVPPAIAAAAGWSVAAAIDHACAHLAPTAALVLASGGFLVAAALALRFLFAARLVDLLARLPASDRARRWLRLPAPLETT